MARHYNLPFRASNANAANALDAQAVWESAFSLQGSCSGGANLIYHAAGWMEGGLSASFEKFVIDCEMLQQIIYAQRPIIVDEASLAVSAIEEVGPHGHFFGCDHTQERYRDAFTRRFCLIGGILKIGKMPADYGRISAPTPISNRFWPNIRRRQWIAAFMMNCWISSIGAKPKVAHQPISSDFTPSLEKWLFIKRAFKHITINIAA